MSQREVCSNYADVKKRVKCGHIKESHHAERVSSPDGIPRIEYFACLCYGCDCPGYIPERGIR